MNLQNVFYFKNIVDGIYPDENCKPINTADVVNEVKKKIALLSDDDFIEIMISCFIPDLYSGMGKCEKLFTKLTELMVGEWWYRLGGIYNLPTKKSGTQDVELIYNTISIVCDAKVFRLGRSQKAPNVKDFLKLASVKTWIDNLNKEYQDSHVEHDVIGGLVTYSSLHEWESDSEVYEECTNLDIPVVMLPYEVMSLLLNYKGAFKLADFIKLWNYRDNQVTTSRAKSLYWNYVSKFICNLLSLTEDEYNNEIKSYHQRIILACSEYRKIIQDNIDEVKHQILLECEPYMTYDSLKNYVVNQIILRDNATAIDYLKHLEDFRHYSDVDNTYAKDTN